MKNKDNKTREAGPKKKTRKRISRQVKRRRGTRLPFPPAFARRLGYKCTDMAMADLVLHRYRPRLRKTMAFYCQKYSEIGEAFDRGRLLFNLTDAARGVQTVSQAAKLLGFEHGRALRELLDTDSEINSVWEQNRIKTGARAKKALVKSAEQGNQAAIKAVEAFLYDEGEGTTGRGVNINYQSLGIDQTAKLFSVTRQTIYVWYTKNGLPRNGDGTINLKEARKWFEAFTRSKVTEGAVIPADSLRDLKAEQMRMNLAVRRHELLEQAEVTAGLAERWQKITAAFKYRTRELASMVHNQTVDGCVDILGRFFAELQAGWLEVPEFLHLSPKAQEKFIELMEAIRSNGTTEENKKAGS